MNVAVAKPAQRDAAREPRPSQSEQETPEPEFIAPAPGGCACGGGCPRCRDKQDAAPARMPTRRMQTKLRLGRVDDPLEQEADRVAEQVLAGPGPTAIASAPPRIQRHAQGSGAVTSSPALPTDGVAPALASGGAPMSPPVLGDMQHRFGRDFSAVRVHTHATAQKSADDLNAEAYTVGNDIVFAAGRYAPQSSNGRRLLAHELTHVVQQAGDGVVLRDATELGVRFNASVSERNWDGAARALMEMGDADARAAISALSDDARGEIRQAAIALDPASDNRVVRLIEEVTSAAPVPPTATTTAPAAPAGDGVAGLSNAQKLWRALLYALDVVGEEAAQELRNLLTPTSLAIMAAFVAAYIAAQLTPIGWVADGIALASLTVAFFFMGRILFDIVRDLFAYFDAMNATTDADLQTAGRALARAVARGGIQLVILLLARGLRGGRGTPSPPTTPPPALAMEMVTAEGVIVRVPAAAVPEVATVFRFARGGPGTSLRGPLVDTAPSRGPPETARGPTAPESPRGPRVPEPPRGPVIPEPPVGPRLPDAPTGPTLPDAPTGPTIPETPVGPVVPETPAIPETPMSPPVSRAPTAPTVPRISRPPERGEGTLPDRLPRPIPAPRRPDPDSEDEETPGRCRGMAVGQRGGNDCHDAFATAVSGTSREWALETPEGDYVEFDALSGGRTLYEIKTGYGFLLNTSPSTYLMREATIARFVTQSENQLLVAERCGYPLIWIFNNRAVAEFVDGFIRPTVTYQEFPCDIDR